MKEYSINLLNDTKTVLRENRVSSKDVLWCGNNEFYFSKKMINC